MNKKISELLERATTVRYSGPGEIYEVDHELFAELIIEECCQALWTDACHMSDLAVEEFNSNSRKIKRHFGVE